MEIAGRVAVITGGASGIGLALARRFAAEGAGGVVVADLDEGGAHAAAAELDGAAIGVHCDVAQDAEVARLIAAAEEAYGAIDLFCANAGVAHGGGLEAPEELWRRAFDVNVRSHVIAARRLVPRWLERGSGYFLATASAAGLLTQIGSAPYAVSKHAAVAFAEWLAVTYGDRGISVSCLCPMGVRTPLIGAGRQLPETDRVVADVVSRAGALLEPEDVADVVVAGLRDERFLILPHPEVLEFLRRKANDYDRWLAGMRRLQASIEDQ
jgi:NAD(P)-dependent dehydrogenase (short-subunit alcohol dehydrogenase family)